MEHPLFKRMSLYLLAIGLIAGLLPVSPANAAKCTSKEISSLKSIDMKMAIASISGDLTELFAEIEKARIKTILQAYRHMKNENLLSVKPTVKLPRK